MIYSWALLVIRWAGIRYWRHRHKMAALASRIRPSFFLSTHKWTVWNSELTCRENFAVGPSGSRPSGTNAAWGRLRCCTRLWSGRGLIRSPSSVATKAEEIKSCFIYMGPCVVPQQPETDHRISQFGMNQTGAACESRWISLHQYWFDQSVALATFLRLIATKINVLKGEKLWLHMRERKNNTSVCLRRCSGVLLSTDIWRFLLTKLPLEFDICYYGSGVEGQHLLRRLSRVGIWNAGGLWRENSSSDC